MNNWFVYLSVFEELYDKVIAETIKDDNFNRPTAVLYNNGQKKTVNIENYTQLDCFADLIEQSFLHEPDLDFIRQLEAEFAISTLSLSIIADRHFGYDEKILNYKQKLSLIELTFKYAINLNQKYSFEFAWFESIGDFLSYILYLVFKKSDVKVCTIVQGQFPGKIAIANDAQLVWEDVEDEIKSFSDIAPSDIEMTKAKKFLDDYRKALPVPSSYSKKSLPSFTSKDLRLFYKWVKASFQSRKKSNIFHRSPLELITIKLRRYLRSIISKRIFEPLSENESQEYAFFPLHVQPEMTTLVCAPYCINQVAVIEDISKSLPVGVQLFVKEHHGMIGRRRIADYLDIKKNWNVSLLGPHEDTMQIIKNAKAVITVNSTVGLQGLLLGKPVVTLARVGYDAGQTIVRANNISRENLSTVIKEAINSIPCEKDILYFLVAVDRILIDGADEFTLEHPSYNPEEVLSNKNITKISEIIKNHFLPKPALK